MPVRIIPGTVKWDNRQGKWRGRGTDRKYYYQVSIKHMHIDDTGIETCVDTPSQIAAVINARLKRQFQRSALSYLEEASQKIGDLKNEKQ